MRSWREIAIYLVTAVLAWSSTAFGGPHSDVRSAPVEVQLLDVPYVPQSGALCGGAALAMVLRYWGKPGVFAEDFSSLLEPGDIGIRTGVLVGAVKKYGWTALPLQRNPTEVHNQLSKDRPVIALIRTRSGSFHYVVLVAWSNGWVILHDPNVGPFRTIRERTFETAWVGSDEWALLVLPPKETPNQSASDTNQNALSSPPPLHDCDAMVDTGVLLAQQGDTVEAETKFRAAQILCPTSASPLRERAGLRFRAEDWAGASRLAEQALDLDPSDTTSWQLLAGSRFLAGDVNGALSAWNHLSEPTTDLIHIDGLMRIRYSAVAGQVDLPPGRLLTPHAFTQAGRRLTELPAQMTSRLSLRPLPNGAAEVDVALLERPLLFNGPWMVGIATAKALAEHGVALNVASPTGYGELWTAGWRWWRNRPRVSMSLAIPTSGIRPGIWRVDGFWERQTYTDREFSAFNRTTAPGVIREERRRTSLTYSDWIGPDLRLEIGTALDKWVDRGSYFSLDGNMETRLDRDRLSLDAEMAKWISVKNGAPFGTGGLSLKWGSDGLDQYGTWQGRVGISTANSKSPLALWSGAGTGSGRAPLLRAHPLLNNGIIEGRAFGRSLAHGTIERDAWPWTLGPLRLGLAFFVDSAKPFNTGSVNRTPMQVDGGSGLRLRGPGIKGEIRVDVAHGIQDGNSAISAYWEAR